MTHFGENNLVLCVPGPLCNEFWPVIRKYWESIDESLSLINKVNGKLEYFYQNV